MSPAPGGTLACRSITYRDGWSGTAGLVKKASETVFQKQVLNPTLSVLNSNCFTIPILSLNYIEVKIKIKHCWVKKLCFSTEQTIIRLTVSIVVPSPSYLATLATQFQVVMALLIRARLPYSDYSSIWHTVPTVPLLYPSLIPSPTGR